MKSPFHNRTHPSSPDEARMVPVIFHDTRQTWRMKENSKLLTMKVPEIQTKAEQVARFSRLVCNMTILTILSTCCLRTGLPIIAIPYQVLVQSCVMQKVVICQVTEIYVRWSAYARSQQYGWDDNPVATARNTTITYCTSIAANLLPHMLCLT